MLPKCSVHDNFVSTDAGLRHKPLSFTSTETSNSFSQPFNFGRSRLGALPLHVFAVVATVGLHILLVVSGLQEVHGPARFTSVYLGKSM